MLLIILSAVPYKHIADVLRNGGDYFTENQAILCISMIDCKLKSTILYVSQTTTPMIFVSTRFVRQRHQLIEAAQAGAPPR